MTPTLKGKTALVTGASRGIGRGISLRLAREGTLVAVHYGRNRDAAAAVVQEIVAEGGRGFAIQADVTSDAEIRKMFETLERKLDEQGANGLDILVNNAGVLVPGLIDDYTEAQFDCQIDTNFKGLFFVTKYALPLLRHGGRIINVTSGTARRANPAMIAYSATKAAVNYFTLALADHLGKQGITVNSLAPGLTETDMVKGMNDNPVIARTLQNTALGRIGQVEDIAGVAAFLASEDARWVTGEVFHVTGGELL